MKGGVRVGVARGPAVVDGVPKTLHRKCACGRTVTTPGGECAECAKKRKELKRSAVGRGGPQSAPPLVHHVLGSAGRRLEPGVRATMETRFAADFGRVRIHTDSAAAESARAVDAHAYTVGNHIVFGAGKYSVHESSGRDLLAHELAHVALSGMPNLTPGGSLAVEPASSPDEAAADALARRAMSGAAPIAPLRASTLRLRRRWDKPRPGDCTDVPDERWLKKVVVEQESKQFVTLHWNDGSLETAGCSTGKGHCCTDSPDGVVCDRERSRTPGSNCTPISSGAEFSIVHRDRDHKGIEFWNEIIPSPRFIALHHYSPVTGEPLSHGCVRLAYDTARHIFCGARQKKTRVEVRGYARPKCSDPYLRKEWKDDIERSAPDRKDGEESRRIVKDGYGRDLTDKDRMDLLGASPKLPLPPGCPSGRTAPPPSAEESSGSPTPTGTPHRVPSHADATQRDIVPGNVSPTTAQQILEASGLESSIPRFIAALAGAASLLAARSTVRTQGRRLWSAATARAQGRSANTDDRPLYWARLEMSRALRGFQPKWALSAADREALLQTFESASRGRDTADFAGANKKSKRILISGFDPFGDASSGLGNPSGAAALALDGQTLTSAGFRAQVEAVIFPVRFADFNLGVVEKFFARYLDGTTRVDMVMTVSMGGSDKFEVEEYAARRRTNDALDPDNLGVRGDLQQPGAPLPKSSMGSRVPPTNPTPGVAAGPEFLKTTLPAAVRGGLRSQPLPEETEITEVLKKGGRPVRRATGGPTAGSTAIKGSGGNYLSNEIFYRTRLLRDSKGSGIPMGHLHTPVLGSPTALGPQGFASARDAMVARIRQILLDTIPSL